MEKKHNNFGIINLFGKNNDCKLNVVFIHGLNKDAYNTWKNEYDEIWPLWLFDDFNNIAVWTIGYDATSSAWKKDTMSMSERGKNLIAEIHANENLGNKPLFFIVHSMGGLILKYILELSHQQHKYIDILNNTKGIVFLATPHNGSNGANILKDLNIIYRANFVVKELSKDNNELNRLEDSFRNLVTQNNLKCFTFYETQEVRKENVTFCGKEIPLPFIRKKGIKIVTRDSAKGTFNQENPIPLDKDHINICKLKSKDELVYKKIIEYISEILNENNTSEEKSYKEILNSFKDTEEKKKSTNRVFLIFNADDISDKIYNVVGYIEDNNEYESDFLEFTFNDIHNESEQEEFLRLLYEKSQLINIPVHFIIPPELFLVNFKLWKYEGTELIKIYNVLFHNKNKFSMNSRGYSSLMNDWNTKFSTFKDKNISKSLLPINGIYDTFDCRINKIGAYFTYQPEIHENIEKVVRFANIGIWNYSSGDIIKYKEWLNGTFNLSNIKKESRNYDHVALLWDDMSLLKDLKDMRG